MYGFQHAEHSNIMKALMIFIIKSVSFTFIMMCSAIEGNSMHVKLSSERKPSIYMIEDFVLDVAVPIRKAPGGI